MLAASILAALVAPAFINAYPLGRRDATSDAVLVFQFADVLEQLETKFYAGALQKFQASDITGAGFSNAQLVVEQLTAIQSDEQTHATGLEAGLASFGQKPISSSCQFSFDSVLTDLPTTLATARVVEQLGVSAYLGAAHLLQDPVLLGTAASILTVEARHQTVLNIMSGAATVIPQAFDVALTPSEVLATAGAFFTGCDLGVPANPSLAISNTGAVNVGTQLTFKSAAITGDTSNLSCQMITGGMTFAVVLPFSQCVVPAGINGPVAIFVTNDTQPLANNIRDRATNKLVAGPTLAFIDSTLDTLPKLVRTVQGAQGAPAVVTATISPDQASSIIASASASPAAATGSASPAAASAAATGSAAAAPSAADPAAPAASVVATTPDPANDASLNKAVGPTLAGGVNVVGWGTVPASS